MFREKGFKWFKDLLMEQQDKGKEGHSPLSEATKEVRGEARACGLCLWRLGTGGMMFAFSLGVPCWGLHWSTRWRQWPTQGWNSAQRSPWYFLVVPNLFFLLYKLPSRAIVRIPPVFKQSLAEPKLSTVGLILQAYNFPTRFFQIMVVLLAIISCQSRRTSR